MLSPRRTHIILGKNSNDRHCALVRAKLELSIISQQTVQELPGARPRRGGAKPRRKGGDRGGVPPTPHGFQCRLSLKSYFARTPHAATRGRAALVGVLSTARAHVCRPHPRLRGTSQPSGARSRSLFVYSGSSRCCALLRDLSSHVVASSKISPIDRSLQSVQG